MIKKKWKQRFWSAVLCMGMVFQSLPVPVSAMETSGLQTQKMQAEEHWQDELEEQTGQLPEEQPQISETATIVPHTAETQDGTESETITAVETQGGMESETTTETVGTQDGATSGTAESETATGTEQETESAEMSESVEISDVETEQTETEQTETEQSEQLETQEKTMQTDERAADTGTTLILENNSTVMVEGVTRDKGQWIQFTAPEDGIYRFGWEYNEDDNLSPAFCFMYSDKVSLTDIPDRLEDIEVKDPLLTFDYSYGFRLERNMSKGENIYLFVKLQNSDLPQDFLVYARTVRAAMDISVGNTYEIKNVNDNDAQWLIFQAPKSGFYEIRSSEPQADANMEWKPYFFLYRQISGEYWGDDDNGTNMTFYAKEGQTRYIKAGTMDDSEGSHVKGSYKISVVQLSGITFDITQGISKITVGMETDSIGGILPQIYYRKTGDTEWKSMSGMSADASEKRYIELKGLEPDTEYFVEARFGYYHEGEEVVLHAETVHTKSMEGSYEQQVGDYQVKWQTESSYGGFSLSAQFTKAGHTDAGTAENCVEVHFYVRQEDGEWAEAGPAGGQETSLGVNRTWVLSGLDFGASYRLGIRIREPSAESEPSENTEVTELTGGTVTVEIPETLRQVTMCAGCQYIVIKMPKRFNIGHPMVVQDGKGYNVYSVGEQGTDEGFLYSWYLPVYDGQQEEFKDFQTEKEFDVRFDVNENGEHGYLVLKGQKLTPKPDVQELAGQITARADAVTYDLDSDKAPSLTVPVTLGTIPEGLHLALAPALAEENGDYTYYRYGECYGAASDTSVSAQITGVEAQQTGKLVVCLLEDIYLGMGKDGCQILLYRNSDLAQITVMEKCTIPNSGRTVTLKNTVMGTTKAETEITAGNTLEGEELRAYARYWTTSDKTDTGQYTEEIRLSSQNAYTGKLIFDALEGGTKYHYAVYLYREYGSEDEQYRVGVLEDNSYTFTTGSADNITLKELSVKERYAGGADIFVSMSEKIESINMLTFYYREKGQQEWIKYLKDARWEECCIIDAEGSALIQLNGLKAATEYEYYVSFFGKDFSEGVVTDKSSGRYKTFYTRTAEEVIREKAEIIPQSGYASLTLNGVIPDRTVAANITLYRCNNDDKEYCYFREVPFNTMEEGADHVYRKTIDIPKLTPETVYEYQITYTVNPYGKLGDMETGTFTTKKQGSDEPEFEMNPDDEKLAVVIPELIFNHEEQKAKPQITYDGRMLVEGRDYDVVYSDADYSAAGMHTLEIHFRGNYGGTITQSYTIRPFDIQQEDTSLVVVFPILYFSGTEQKAKPEITYNGWRLAEDADYTLAYTSEGDDYTSVGEHEAFISFRGNYAGEVEGKYDIKACRAENMDAALQVYIPSAYFNKKVQYPRPEVFFGKEKLIQGIDYHTEYPEKNEAGEADDHKSVGEHTLNITFMGNYQGSVTRTYTIYDRKKASSENTLDIKTLKFSLNKDDVKNAYFTGNAIEPKVEVKGLAVTEGIHYKTVYKNNYNAGKATMMIIGLGASSGTGQDEKPVTYIGTKTLSFTIKKPNIKKDVIPNEYKKEYSYKGSPVLLEDFVLTLNASSDVPYVLEKNMDYTVSYKRNNTKGTATATIKGTGNFTGSVQYAFSITPFGLDENEENIKNAVSGVEYSPKGAKLKTIALGGVTLREGTDYKTKYTYADKKGKKAGTTVKIELTGKNACEGKVILENVPIVEASLSTCITVPSDLILDAARKDKGRAALKVTDYTGVKLKNDKDYILVWDPNESTAPAGSSLTLTIRAAEGSDYKGEKTVPYRIASKLTSLKKLKVKDTAVFDGRHPVTLTPEKIVYGNEEPFKDGEIIISAYKNNTRAGTAQMTIQGMGRFYGTKTLKFKITDGS